MAGFKQELNFMAINTSIMYYVNMEKIQQIILSQTEGIKNIA